MPKPRSQAPRLKAPELQRDRLYIYTDGSSAFKGGRYVGAWSAVLLYNGHKLEIAGTMDGGTIGHMELLAMEQGLLAVTRRDVPIEIVSDSTYAIETMTVHWKAYERRQWTTAAGKPVANAKLIRRMLPLVKGVAFRWVKGPSTNTWNHLADRLATEARQQMEVDLGLRSKESFEQSQRAMNVEKLDTEGNVFLDGNGRVIIRNARGIEKLNLNIARARDMAYAILTATEDTAGTCRAKLYGPTLGKAIEDSVAEQEAMIEAAKPPAPPPPRVRVRTRTVGAA